MQVNIYYGGRGLIEDPAIHVITKLTEVLNELRVKVCRYNLYEDKNVIATLPATLKDADGVILATTVEWYGIGGYMQQFLDMCWFYGDKEKLSGLYMMPVVTAVTYGEREAALSLTNAWEILGGIPIDGVSAYVENIQEFEGNASYGKMIEKKAEMLYRTISQKASSFPTSNRAVKENLLHTRNINLTPQESEQLSRFVSDDGYVKKQKQDIEELTAMFKQLLGEENQADPGQQQPKGDTEFIGDFTNNYYPEPDFSATYALVIPEKETNLIIEATPQDLKCYYSDSMEADVVMKVPVRILHTIIDGKSTFQKGFMSGEITAKGNFKTLRTMDQIFRFRYKK